MGLTGHEEHSPEEQADDPGTGIDFLDFAGEDLDEDVGDQEALKDRKQDYTINSIKREEDDQVRIHRHRLQRTGLHVFVHGR